MMSDVRKTIQDAVIAYLNTPNPRYIFLIGGEPGLGKTHFVTTELQQAILDAHRKLHESKSEGISSIFSSPLLALHRHLTLEEKMPRYFSLTKMISVNMLQSALSLPRDVEPTNAARFLSCVQMFENHIYVRLTLVTLCVAMIPYSFFFEPGFFLSSLALFTFYVLFLSRDVVSKLLGKFSFTQKIIEKLRTKDYLILDDVDKASFPMVHLADFAKQLILEKKAKIVLITDRIEQTVEALSQKVNVKYVTGGGDGVPLWKDDATGVVLYVYRFTNDSASIAAALDHFLPSLPNSFQLKKEQKARLLQFCEESNNTNLSSIFELAKQATNTLEKLYRDEHGGVMNTDDVALKILNKILSSGVIAETEDLIDSSALKERAIVTSALDHYAIEVDPGAILSLTGENTELKSEAKALESLATMRLASQRTPYQIKEAYETLVKSVRAKKVAPNLLLEIFLISMKLRMERLNLDIVKMQRAMEYYLETSDAIPFFDNSNYDLSIFDVQASSGELINCAPQLKKIIELTERNILRRVIAEFLNSLQGDRWGESFDFFVFNNGFHFARVQQLFSLVDPAILAQKIRASSDAENLLFFNSVLKLYRSPIVDVYFPKDRVSLVKLVNALDEYLIELRAEADFTDDRRRRIATLKAFVDEIERIIRKIPLLDPSE